MRAFPTEPSYLLFSSDTFYQPGATPTDRKKIYRTLISHSSTIRCSPTFLSQPCPVLLRLSCSQSIEISPASNFYILLKCRTFVKHKMAGLELTTGVLTSRRQATEVTQWESNPRFQSTRCDSKPPQGGSQHIPPQIENRPEYFAS